MYHDVQGVRRHLAGWKKDRPDHRDRMLMSAPTTFIIPLKGDLRSLSPRVEDQKDLGACTAHATTSAMEYVKLKLGLSQEQFSRLFLYYASRVWVEKIQPSDDAGAIIRDVMRAAKKFGVCREDLWPYDTSVFDVDPPQTAKDDAKKHQIISYFRCPSLRLIRQSIAQGYPVVGGFSVPQNMMSDECAKTGIVQYPHGTEEIVGGHAVLFMGYDDTKNLLTFENSWGSGWGDKGFGYLPYEFVTNWLADDFWTIRSEET